jgi:tRNA A37 threonylcarbamoyladenosine biosynthesis protein TsaE
VQARASGLTEAQLQRYGEALGAALRPGHVVLLQGPMGAGKTTLTRALAHGLRVARPDRVRSPTFNICLVHDGPIPLHHVDLFRLAMEDDGEPSTTPRPSPAFGALGLETLFEDHAPPGLAGDHATPGLVRGTEGGVVVVEWAELMRIEVEALTISLQHAGPDRRDIEISARGARHEPLVAILNSVTSAATPNPA